MSKTKPKRIPVALLKGAYKHAEKACNKASGYDASCPWEDIHESQRMGFRVFARYILKHQPK